MRNHQDRFHCAATLQMDFFPLQGDETGDSASTVRRMLNPKRLQARRWMKRGFRKASLCAR
jgi:hypothetical protein